MIRTKCGLMARSVCARSLISAVFRLRKDDKKGEHT